jgi:hypothetical protein
VSGAVASQDWKYAGPACPHCGFSLDTRSLISGPQICRACRRTFEAIRFDPPVPDSSVLRVAEAGPEGANACAHHAGNSAVAHCSRCGIFICSLCRIEADRKVLCPACFERLSDEGALPSTIAFYRDYGRAQSLTLLLGLVVIFAGPVTGPASIYLGIKRIRQMQATGEYEGLTRTYLMFVLGLAEIVFGVGIIAAMVRT